MKNMNLTENTEDNKDILQDLHNEFTKQYARLYNSTAILPSAREIAAYDRFDSGLTDQEKLIRDAYVDFRHDYISSDREVAAFIFALDKIQKRQS